DRTGRAVGVDVPPDVRGGDHRKCDLPRRNDIDVEGDEVMEEHEYRHEHDEQPVLRIGQLDRQGVAGRSEIDESGPVDVVVSAQPHECLSEDQLDQTFAEEEQGASARDEGETDDRYRGAGEHAGHLTLAGAADEDDPQDGEQNRGDLGGDELDNRVRVDTWS